MDKVRLFFIQGNFFFQFNACVTNTEIFFTVAKRFEGGRESLVSLKAKRHRE